MDAPQPNAANPAVERERGASATEYGLIVVAIAALIAVVVFALGGVVKDLFFDTCSTIRSGAATTTTCG